MSFFVGQKSFEEVRVCSVPLLYDTCNIWQRIQGRLRWMQKSFKHLGGSSSTFCTLSVIHRVRSSYKHKHRYDVAGLLLNYRIYLSRLIHTIIIFSIYITCVRVENTLYLVCGDIPFKCLKTMPYQTMEDTPPPSHPTTAPIVAPLPYRTTSWHLGKLYLASKLELRESSTKLQ